MRIKSEDHYSILGVKPSASDDAIKAAFRTRAKALHPDKNPEQDSTASFQRVQAAYAILGNPDQRRRYDFARLAVGIDQAPTAAQDMGDSFFNRRRIQVSVILAAAAAIATVLVYLLRPTPELAPSVRFQARGGSFTDLGSLGAEMESAVYQSARNYSGLERPALAEVELEGRNGRRYVLAAAIAQQLIPRRDQLRASSIELNGRSRDLKERHDLLERDRQSLAPTARSAIRSFNDRVEALNRDSADFARDLDEHKNQVDSFLAEVERVALRMR
jgi:curved DNA-binding protein CbpA